MFKSHALERIEQRYNLQLRGWELKKILCRIEKGLYIKKWHSDKNVNNVFYFYVLYKNIPLKIVAKPTRVITVYPLDVDEYNRIKEERKIMLKKFMTPTCAACKKLSSILDQLGVDYEEVNVLDNVDIVKQYDIKVLPTLLDDNGNKLEGLQTITDIKGFCGLEA